ncbi:MAG: D-glycero-beta-D-manno-heptose 1,7-bisphosphate 7-phosphatase [Desulfuromonadaceae bacterium]|nr:D-glycero-beta-D-manno-heptose 1,7-bisphosphate 7-phosphatase [Desulfuromonadaceae bacterium]
MKRAVFLDRDGTINVEKDYLFEVKDFEFIPGATEAIRLLNGAGYFVVVVSNQSGVARGYYTEEDVELLHRHIADELQKSGARVDAWMFCPHHPDGRGSYSLPCSCRKPLPGMLLEAAHRHDIDLRGSVMVGDKLADIAAGMSAGCRTFLVRTGYGADQESLVSSSTEVYDDLLAAVKTLLQPLHPV